jgi:tRNA threonylcarbamoyladenosine biosynthesis protein TsaB
VIVLSLDSTTGAGSAAVVEDDTILVEKTGDARLTHGERLPGEVIRVLEEARVPLADVDLLAVAAGPGSFTGLRVGIAAMQGLAVATGRRIVPISALDALAHAARSGRERIAVWMDAQRGQVFARLFDAAGTPLVEPSALPPVQTLVAWGREVTAPHDIRFIGDGAVRYAEVIRAELRDRAAIVEPPPLAGVIGTIAAAHPDRAVSPHAVVPIYIRRPDAEIARLQKTSRP